MMLQLLYFFTIFITSEIVFAQIEMETFLPLSHGSISTNEFEFGGTFTPDGNEFYFTRRPTYEGSDNRIYYSKKVNDEWTKAIRAPFSGNHFEFLPMIIPDGNKLFFYSEREKPENTDSEGNIWYCTRKGNEWSESRYFKELYDVKYCMMVSATIRGTIYFAGVYNNKRGVFRSEYRNGQYSEPIFLPEIINSLHPAHPFIAPDESYLIFDAQVSGMGKSEVYITFRNNNETWINPQKFGPEINATKTEFAASISPDGKQMFFHRRVNENGDIYCVDLKSINGLLER